MQEVLENIKFRSVLAKIYRRVRKTEQECNNWKNNCFNEFQEL